MNHGDADRDCRQVFALTEEEAAAVEAGDIDRYLSLLSDDAVFLPQNVSTKTGEDLRQWLREFLDRVSIRYLEFAHGETVIRDDLACHEYTCRWTATPRSGGQPAVMSFKGLHVLRRQRNGSWKISRNIWNTNPTGEDS
jgi:ketosteroid isomerase-like protein